MCLRSRSFGGGCQEILGSELRRGDWVHGWGEVVNQTAAPRPTEGLFVAGHGFSRRLRASDSRCDYASQRYAPTGGSAPLGELIRRRTWVHPAAQRHIVSFSTACLAEHIGANGGLMHRRPWLQLTALRPLVGLFVAGHRFNRRLRAHWWAYPSQAMASTGGSAMAAIRRRSASPDPRPSVPQNTSARRLSSLLPLRLIPAVPHPPAAGRPHTLPPYPPYPPTP